MDLGLDTVSDGCIELRSGGFFDFANPTATSIELEDIAHGLAHTCRFSGQCRVFYSVAEHTVLVADYLASRSYSPIIQLAGLHHDDAEAFVTDVPRPAKPLLPDYGVLEVMAQNASLNAIGYPDLPVYDPLVKEGDEWALAQEAYELMPSQGRYWDLGAVADGQARDLGIPPLEAKARWLAYHQRLVDQL